MQMRGYPNTQPLSELVYDPTKIECNDFETHKEELFFICPLCLAVRGAHAHSIMVPFVHTNRHGYKHRTVWTFTGDSIANLTVSPSIRVLRGCGFHGSITNGIVEWE